MELVTHAVLDSLVQSTTGQQQVSLFMPTHRFGTGIEADMLAWKNLVDGVERVLGERVRRTDAEDLLAPARALQNDTMGWQYMSDGLAMLLRPGWERTLRVPAPMPTLATVGDHLVMGPLLRLFSGDEHFFLLALSQRQVRLMEGSRNTVEEVVLTDVPTNLRDVIAPPEPRSDTMTRSAARAGSGGPAVFYGHGGADRHLKREDVTQFLQHVASGLRDVLAGQTAPLVLVGLDHLVAAYRAVNSYGHVLDEAVIHNADQLSTEQLHERAWPVVEQRLRDERARTIERFRALHGTGRVSSELRTVADAAAQGRVETLFVKADPWCWERIVDSLPIVQLGADERYTDCEQVDAAAMATLNNGGQVYATSQTVVAGSEVAAIFRY